MAQVLDNVVAVGPLAAGAVVVVPHGLVQAAGPLTPHIIIPDRSTPIVVVSADATNITFRNQGNASESASFWARFDISNQAPASRPVHYWQGPSGPGSFLLSSPQFEDLRVPVTSTHLIGPNQPTPTKFRDNGAGSTGVYTYAFSAGVEQELFFAAQMPHGYKEGTPLDAHIHWSPSDAGAGSVVWGIEYTIANSGAVFPNSTIITAAIATAGDRVDQMSDIGQIAGAGLKISHMIIGRVFRKAADLADTYASVAFFLEVDFHFQADSLGSQTETAK